LKRAALTLIVALIAGCASRPTLPPGAALPAAARAQPGDYVVVTVRNPVVPAPQQAASTPRGYGGSGRYIEWISLDAKGHVVEVRATCSRGWQTSKRAQNGGVICL